MRAPTPWLFVLCTGLAGCADGRGAEIQYSSNEKPLGSWPAPAPTQPMQPSGTGEPDAAPAGSEMRPIELPGSSGASDSDSGMEDMPADSVEPKGAAKPGASTAKDAGGAARRLIFTVLTQVQHMRVSKTDPAFDDDARGPKNMGAIWISKRDGTFVRSLEVWRLHKERARHLQAYNKACECPKPDVTATATLNKHREHTASWDMTDRNGMQVPEGGYTLHIEVADYDVDNPDKPDPKAMNALWSMDFDTHDAPKTLMPEPAQYYTNLKLELLTP